MTRETSTKTATMSKKIAAVLGPALGLLILAGAAAAQDKTDGKDGRGPGRRGPPPPEAFAACKAKKAGDACEVALPDRKINGKCSPGREDETKLVCRPERMGPPPQAFEACAAKKADDACEVTFGERKMAGKCRAGDDGKLACRPDRGPRGPKPQ